jgi:4-hydroxy-3-polyprenylbenzoate decarboxylase
MRIVVAVTGASGAGIGLRLVKELAGKADVKTIATEAGMEVVRRETAGGFKPDYMDAEVAAQLASSSQPIDAMVACPCSMKTLSAIANGYSNNLVTRAADACLRTRRMLVLCVRETPLSVPALENMLKAAKAGAIILPLNAAYYFRPKTLEDMEGFFVGKVLDVLGLQHQLYRRWQG